MAREKFHSILPQLFHTELLQHAYVVGACVGWGGCWCPWIMGPISCVSFKGKRSSWVLVYASLSFGESR